MQDIVLCNFSDQLTILGMLGGCNEEVDVQQELFEVLSVLKNLVVFNSDNGYALSV